MDIYTILSSKEHNPHYLKRYYDFVMGIKAKDQNGEFMHKHHICPKSQYFFPEYKSLHNNPWNKVVMTPRQHYVAHWMLWKAYGGTMAHAFWMMHKAGTKRNSRTFEMLSIDRSKLSATVGFSTLTFERRSEIKSKWANENKEMLLANLEKGREKSRATSSARLKAFTPEQRKANTAKSIDKQRREGVGFFNKEYMKENCSEWGKRSIQSQTGFKFYNDGTRDFKYLPKHQKEMSFDDFMKLNEGKYFRGRIMKYRECPHCGTVITIQLYARWHGDKCRTPPPDQNA